jgi:two-component system, cell cycle response regulator
LTAAERVQAAVRSITDPVALTATIGVATAVGRAADADYLLTAADDALYRGKAAGRDQIVRSDRSEVH